MTIETYRIVFLSLSLLTAAMSLERIVRWFRSKPSLGGSDILAERYRIRSEFRRFQLGILLLITSFFLFLGSVFSPERQTSLFVLSWFLVIVFLFWTIILGFSEMLMVGFYHRRLRSELLDAEIRDAAAHYRRRSEKELKKGLSKIHCEEDERKGS